jgi:hypothetical protein
MPQEPLRLPDGRPEPGPPTSRAARPRLSPEAAVRSELRVALHELADALLNDAPRSSLLDAIRHAWILADLADVDDGLPRTLLRNLQRDLMGQSAIEPVQYANQLTFAASKV